MFVGRSTIYRLSRGDLQRASKLSKVFLGINLFKLRKPFSITKNQLAKNLDGVIERMGLGVMEVYDRENNKLTPEDLKKAVGTPEKAAEQEKQVADALSEGKRKAEEELAKKKAAEEEAQKKADEEKLAKEKAEAEAKKKAEKEEAEKKAAEEEAEKKSDKGKKQEDSGKKSSKKKK